MTSPGPRSSTRTHAFGTFVLGILLALANAGCRRLFIASGRAGALARLEERQAVLYRLSWGTAITEDARAQGRRRFDCTWDAITDAGGDPRGDLACLTRQVDATIHCLGEHRVDEDCFIRSRAVCTMSREFETAAVRCRDAITPPHTSR